MNDNKASPYRKYALYISQQMSNGLRYLGSKRIIHRDLKPENFLIMKLGKKFRVKLTDFGLSHYFDRISNL